MFTRQVQRGSAFHLNRSPRFLPVAAVFVLAMLLTETSRAETIRTTVSWVWSGTVLETAEGARVSLLGCYAPVVHDDDAADLTHDLTDGQSIILESVRRMNFPGREDREYLLAYVRLEDGTDLGEELLSRGMAAADTLLEHDRLRRYRQLHRWAEENRIGYWALPASRRPHEDRRETQEQSPPPRSQEDLLAFFEANKDPLVQCYQIARRRNPSLSGRIRVVFNVEASGEVSDIRIASSEWNDEGPGRNVEQCVTARVSRWQYPPVDEGVTPAEFSLVFR